MGCVSKLGFYQFFFIDNHTKSMVGRVLLKFLLIIIPKARVILVIFRGKHRKNDAELFLTIIEGKISVKLTTVSREF